MFVQEDFYQSDPDCTSWHSSLSRVA
jgi:hypothetical protein